MELPIIRKAKNGLSIKHHQKNKLALREVIGKTEAREVLCKNPDRMATRLESEYVSPRLIWAFMQKKGDLFYKDSGGATLLHSAAKNSLVFRKDPEFLKRTIEELLKHGADPQAKDKQGRTPADYAKEVGSDVISELLKQAKRKFKPVQRITQAIQSSRKTREQNKEKQTKARRAKHLGL